jgi:hypothetical protein
VTEVIGNTVQLNAVRKLIRIRRTNGGLRITRIIDYPLVNQTYQSIGTRTSSENFGQYETRKEDY